MSSRRLLPLVIAVALLAVTPSSAHEPLFYEPAPESLFRPVQTPTPLPASPSPSPSPKPKPPVVPTVAQAKDYALAMLVARYNANGHRQYDCLHRLWQRESGWRTRALNRSSGAYGIPQALPGSKMSSAGADWRINPVTQVIWGIRYISGRYDTPCNALSHALRVGWY